MSSFRRLIVHKKLVDTSKPKATVYWYPSRCAWLIRKMTPRRERDK